MMRVLSRKMLWAVCCTLPLLSGVSGAVPSTHAQGMAPAPGPAKLVAIRITAGTTTISAELVDHATTRDFLRQLPMTVRMTRSGEREYHGRPDTPISVEGPRQTRFRNGDLGYWAPGGYLAIFLDNTVRPEIADLIVMGRVTSDLVAIQRLGPSVEMTIERASVP